MRSRIADALDNLAFFIGDLLENLASRIRPKGEIPGWMTVDSPALQTFTGRLTFVDDANDFWCGICGGLNPTCSNCTDTPPEHYVPLMRRNGREF